MLSRKPVLTLLLGVFGVSAAVAAARSTVEPAANPSLLRADVSQRTIQIRTWENALATDSLSAIALAQLAGLHLQLARETDNDAELARAEEYARRSLALRTSRNGKTYVTLAAALLAQHRFAEAESAAARLVALEPDIPQYRALLGEIQMELGKYDEARISFDSSYRARRHLSVAPRLARWAELNGRTDEARRIWREALADAQQRRDLPAEQVAWFHLRLAETEMRYGRNRTARGVLEKALAATPDDSRVIMGLAQLEAATGDLNEALKHAERAVALRRNPETLAFLATMAEARGYRREANRYADSMKAAMRTDAGPWHRAWGMFLLDRNEDTERVLSLARDEYVGRRDIYGADQLAWALHKNGRSREAAPIAREALRLGTKDPLLLFHAAVIHAAAGDRRAAFTYVENALAVNPQFHPIHARTARSLRDSLKPAGGTPFSAATQR